MRANLAIAALVIGSVALLLVGQSCQSQASLGGGGMHSLVVPITYTGIVPALCALQSIGWPPTLIGIGGLASAGMIVALRRLNRGS